ncbi:MAG: molybdate ABC transporter permease subunit [Armatimonadetes bacterium]|nr:molybdate ABC transporter permease subunit [Armatimonadota bacterium]NIO75672.1 molybdate ABC transporter permease subunit [Armatimonadota bacterium]NIO98666.1 molybdate ABC transporter permease subunit [Armatimonadota bacterium]
MQIRRFTFTAVMILCIPLLAFVLATLAGLFAHVNLRQFGIYVCCPQVTNALRISLYTTLISTFSAVVLGTPVAYLLAHCRFRGWAAIDTLVELPLVLPPSAAGLALLMAFGQKGLTGYLQAHGIDLRFGLTFFAVVMAQLFVASPFFIKHARTGFEAVSNDLKLASTTLGASAWRTFFRITVPLSSRALIAGATMTWARALGEFGATLMVGGALEGRTETMPIAIYTALDTNMPAAISLAATLVTVSFIVLITTKILLGRSATLTLGASERV